MNSLAPLPAAAGQVRSFASYTDSVTGVEMAFAGSDPYGIFSGGFNSASNTIAWGSTAEAGSRFRRRMMARVNSPCDELRGLWREALCLDLLRHPRPHRWAKSQLEIVYQYSGPDVCAVNSGFRGLTCVPNLNGSGSMLIASLEGPGDIYDIPLDGSAPTIELHMSNYLASQLGAWVSYAIAAYNNMVDLPSIWINKLPRSSHGFRVYRIGELSKRIR